MTKILFTILLLFISMLCVVRVYAALQDPTRPEAVVATSDAKSVDMGFKLTAILIYPDHKIAVINGQGKKMGDVVSGSHIIKIEENTVQLDGPSGKITLFLLGKSVKHVSLGGP